METDIARILFTQDQIRRRVRELAREIAAAYANSGAGLTIMPILSGSLIFLADLIRELPIKMKIGLVQISTYPARTTTPMPPRTLLPPVGDIRGRDVLVVDDILDSGRTLRHVLGLIRAQQPATIRTAVLLRKPVRVPADLPVEYVGFDVEDSFVVGYGLDYDDYYRNFPHIGVLAPERMT